MLVHCVNPTCYAPLQSFCEGRLFQFEVVSISISAAAEGFDEEPLRQTANYWLCGRCAAEMTLVLEPRRGLRVVPVSHERRGDTESGFLVADEEFREANNC
jgi:hypothetical protein